MAQDSKNLEKRMELLAAYQMAVENYAAAIQALDRARGTAEYARLSRLARNAHVMCDEARMAVATHRLQGTGTKDTGA